MMAVGDQQLARLELGGDRLVHGGVADPPDAVGGAVRVRDLAPRLIAESRLEVLPGIPGVEGEDRREVGMGRAGQPEAVLLRAGLGPLVRPDALAVGRELHAGEEAPAGEARAVGRRVVLLERPDLGLRVAGQDALVRPLREQCRGVLVGVAAAGIAGQVELDDVVRGASDELSALLVVDHVIGRGDDVAEGADPAEVVMECLKWKYLRHGRDSLDSLCTGCGAAW